VIELSGRVPRRQVRNSLSIARQRRDPARPLLDLTESNPTRAGLGPPGALLRSAVSRPEVTRYEPAPFGLRAAREALVQALHEDHGASVDADSVALVASTSEAYGLLFRVLGDPGDTVAVPTPSYPLFSQLARLEALRVSRYRLRPGAGDWHLVPSTLRKPPRGRLAAVVAVHPNNPTGSYLSRAEAAALRNRADRAGAVLVVDEVFFPYPLSPPPDAAPSFTTASGSLCVALGGLSKALCLPQLKLGWMVVSGPLRERRRLLSALDYACDAYLSASAPAQAALPALLEVRHDVQRAVERRLRSNLELLDRALGGSAISRLPVEGGWYAVLRLPAAKSSNDWALTLLEQDDVFVHPGELLDLPGRSDLVCSLLCLPEVFAEGAARLAARVSAVV
jgi:alanine-synthesizing transaminase